MNVIAARPMTFAQFLAWEERQDERHEFDGARPVAMNGGTRAHQLIQANVLGLLWSAVRRGRYRAYAAGMKLRIGDRVRYPDVLVAENSEAMSETVETAALMLFEVLSPSTAVMDRTVKLAEYRALASLQRYVMLEQSQMAATVIARGTGAVWTHEVLLGADSVLALPEIGVTLRLGDCYEGVTWRDADAE